DDATHLVIAPYEIRHSILIGNVVARVQNGVRVGAKNGGECLVVLRFCGGVERKRRVTRGRKRFFACRLRPETGTRQEKCQYRRHEESEPARGSALVEVGRRSVDIETRHGLLLASPNFKSCTARLAITGVVLR